jgi:hypothetical protein
MSEEAENTIAAAIDAAEDIRDPLEGLVERTKTDPGAAFVPPVVQRLVSLKKEDRAAFEVLRAELKTAGCRMSALDEAMDEENGIRVAAASHRRPTSLSNSLNQLSCSTHRTVRVSPISSSTITGRLGRFVAVVSGTG